MMTQKEKKNKFDFKSEDLYQAVVIADSFDVRFAPLTLKTPRVYDP